MSTSLDDPADGNPYIAALRDPQVYEEVVSDLVMSTAPGLFAVVQEQVDGFDARVAAWGMVFEDRAEVVSVEGNHHFSVQQPERALLHFTVPGEATARLIRVAPDLVLRTLMANPEALPHAWAPSS